MKKIIIVLVAVLVIVVVLISCKKNVPLVDNSNLVAVTVDPYSSPAAMGGSAYYLVKKSIQADNTMEYFSIYPNSTTGGPYSDQQKIYYNPAIQTTVIKFGPQSGHNLTDFITSANQKVKQNGYSIVSAFFDGGPNYIFYSVVQ